MELLLAIVVGALYAAGTYMMLRRNLVKLVLGLALLGYGATLLILSASRRAPEAPPLLVPGRDPGTVADPLPQALVLTAIVIGFGVLTFALVLAQRTWRHTKTDDLDLLRATDT